MVPGVLEPAGSAAMARAQDVVTFRPIRFPTDESHTPPLWAACSCQAYGEEYPFGEQNADWQGMRAM